MIEQADVSWFSSSAPCRDAHPKWLRAFATTLGVVILTTHDGVFQPDCATMQPALIVVLFTGHGQLSRPRSLNTSTTPSVAKSTCKRLPLGSGYFQLEEELQLHRTWFLIETPSVWRGNLGVPSACRKYLKRLEEKTMACTNSWIAVETCMFVPESLREILDLQKFTWPKMGRSH